MSRVDNSGTAQRATFRLCVFVVTAGIGACSSAAPPVTCTSLGQEILRSSAEHAVTVPYRLFVGIAGASDEEFAQRRKEYAACATPIRATVKERLFSAEHVETVERAARRQPDVTAIDHQMEEENVSSWQQIDAATLRVAKECGQDPGSFVRIYEYADGNIVETNPSFTTLMTSHDVRFRHLGAPPIWWRRLDLAMGFFPIRNCVSYRPTEPCVNFRDPDPVIYESWFDSLPSLDPATSQTQLVCRFNFAGSATPSSDRSVRGKGTLDVKTRRVQFIPD